MLHYKVILHVPVFLILYYVLLYNKIVLKLSLFVPQDGEFHARASVSVFFFITFIILHAPLLKSNITCMDDYIYIITSTIYLLFTVGFLIYLVLIIHCTLSNIMLFVNSLKFL